jgi:hypothetical protein
MLITQFCAPPPASTKGCMLAPNGGLARVLLELLGHSV